MKLFTKNQLHVMKLNAIKQSDANMQDKSFDFHPVVKLFTPWANCTWLLTEIDEDEETAFGLCDLGLGSPELGYVSIAELKELSGPAGLKVERDRHFRAEHTLSYYADKARENGLIMD